MLNICARLGESSLVNAFKNSVGSCSVPVRHRYYDPKIKDIPRRYGYNDKLAPRGLLARSAEDKTGMPVQEYLPSDTWSERKALFGQNDYIDILGDQKIHPVSIAYNVPGWLRGFKGSEFQMLIRKRNFFGYKIQGANPDAYNKLRIRIKFLYRRMNHGWFKTRMHSKKEKLKHE